MKPIKVVNLKKAPYDVYIGRGSKWGNPFTHLDNTTAEHRVETREEAIARYEEYIMSNPTLFNQLPELKGKILGCYCKPQACHGDVLKRLCESHFPEALELEVQK
jgi:hypothetical protein